MLVDFTILRKLFPFLNFVAIGLSVTKLILFYKEFGIDIVQYIELPEAIGLFFEDIIWFFLYLFILIVWSIFFMHKVGDENTEIFNKISEEKNFWRRLMSYLWNHKLLLISYAFFHI